MQLSYWEIKNWFSNVDFTIVGSGIVGLHTALALRERFPSSKILILEKGVLPQGASTKNAGFACFGSISEIIDDLKTHTEEEVIQLIQKRYTGLQLLRKNLGDAVIDLKPYGGYELFLKEDESFYNECIQKISFINDIIKPLFLELYKLKFFQFILSKRIICIIIFTYNLNDTLSIHDCRYNFIWIFHGIRTNC